jgi:hypothetical protein
MTYRLIVRKEAGKVYPNRLKIRLYPHSSFIHPNLVVRNKSVCYIFPRQTGAIRAIENRPHSVTIGRFSIDKSRSVSREKNE